MNRCSFWCAGPWPFILLPLLLLLVALFFDWRNIETDVANNTRTDLASIGADWATVETQNRGRGVLITGTAPNEEAIAAVRQKAEQAYGVRAVEIIADVEPEAIPLKPATLEAIVNNDSVTLRGTLASQASINKVVTQAQNAFGAENVNNKLSLAENISELPNLQGFFLALTNKTSDLKSLTASLIGSKLKLVGNINSIDSNTALNAHVNRTLKLDVDNQLVVDSPPVIVASPPAEPEVLPIIEHDQCLEDVTQLLSSSRINFSTGKAVIEQSSYELLSSIKNTALRCPDANFEVSGHTDSTGKLSLNMSLSEQRARAVVNHLENLGLNTSRFTAVGYGPERPIGDNATKQGRAQNRRIEFKLKN